MHASAYVPSRKFTYLIGGFEDGAHLQASKGICVWRTKSREWQSTDGFGLESGRGAPTATVLADNAVVIVGGMTIGDAGQDTAVVFEYINASYELVIDVSEGGLLPEPLWPRWQHSAIATSYGKVLVVGGLEGTSMAYQRSATSEVFNSQWTD